MSGRFSASGLSDAVLEAAASKGLVRRARRDVEAGLVGAPGWDGGTAVLGCDGETVRLPAGPLTAASCSCPASGACRHILAAAIALRDAPPSADVPGAPEADAAVDPVPAPDALAEIRALSPATLAKAFGRAALVRAESLLAALDPAEIAVEARPDLVRIRLGSHPEVHVPAGSGPAGLVSKAARSERAVLHAAALLAVLRPDAAGASEAEATETDASSPATPVLGAGAALTEAVGAILRDAARQALSSAPVALEERFSDLALSSRVEAAPRLAAELRTIAATLRRRRERRDEDDPHDLLHRLARTYALAQALRARPNDPALTGADRGEPAPLAKTRFLGCGVEIWRALSGARGATAHLIREEDGRPFTATLARGAGADPSFSPQGAATGEAVFGQTLERLGSGAFALSGAAAGADGRLALRSGQAATLEGSWREAAEAVPGTVLADWTDVAERLRGAFRPALSERPDRALPLLLRPASLGPVGFDGAAQAGRMAVADAAGAWLELEIEGDERLELHLEALDAARKVKPLPLVSVLARLRGGAVVLSPLAVVRERPRSLDLPAPRAVPRASQGFFGEWAKRFDLSAAWRGRPDALRFEPVPPPSPVRAQLLASCLDELLAFAELGGRMEDPERFGRLEGQAGALRQAGLDRPALFLERLAAASRSTRAHHLLLAAYALGVLAGLEPRLPFVQPAA